MLSAAAAAALRSAAPPPPPARIPWRSLPSRSLSSCRPSTAAAAAAALEPPDLPRLADAARISLSPNEAEEFAPKIQQVVDWFGQLQAIDLETIEPSLRANTEAVTYSREDVPKAFDNREAIIEALPSYSEPYIKVPKVLNKE